MPTTTDVALAAWVDRMATAVRAGLIDENSARRALQRKRPTPDPDDPLLLRLLAGIRDGDAPSEDAHSQYESDLLAQLIVWPDFWAHDHGSEEWIAWPLIPAKRQVAMFAVAKTGKSILSLAACAAIATGRSVFGAPPQRPRSVLYLDYEMTNSDLQERLESLGYGPDDDLSLLHYALLPTLPALNTAAGAIAICELAALVDAEVVVIDTMGRAVEGEENSSDTYKDYARGAGIALRAAGRAVLRTDHAGKTKEQGQRGSSAKNDDVDVVLRLDVAEEGWTLNRTHSRISWVPERVLIRSSEDHEGRRTFTADRVQRVYVPGTKDLADRFRSLGFDGNAARRDVAAQLAALGEKVRTKRIGDALAWMRVEDGRLFTTVPEPGTKPGTTIFADSGNEPGTGGTASRHPSPDRGSRDGNHAEPETEPDGNHPRYVVTGGSQAADPSPF